MTTTIATKTTEYTVTLGYAPTEWEDGVCPDGNPNYDTQPLTHRTVVVTLPTGSSPFDIYCAADDLIDDDAVREELKEQGAYGLDGDGTCIAFNGNEYQNSYDCVSPDTTWDEFFCCPLR